jgi:phosphosulfolactate phosphohydrolase-like enzyme
MDSIVKNHPNSPDAKDDDHPNALHDAVMRLLDTTPMLSDYDEELSLVANQVNIILNDSEDDKLGRIRDLFYKAKTDIADLVSKYHEKSSWHRDIAKQALED